MCADCSLDSETNSYPTNASTCGKSFFCAQVRRHADAPVFNENTFFESSLFLSLPACPEDLVIAVMVYPGESLTDSTIPCLFPRPCHADSLADRYLETI